MNVKLDYTPNPDETADDIAAAKAELRAAAAMAIEGGVTQLKLNARHAGPVNVVWLKTVGPPPAWRMPRVYVRRRPRGAWVGFGWRMTVHGFYVGARKSQP